MVLDDPLSGAYTSLGNYDTDELLALGAASELLGIEPDEVVRRFGRGAIPHFHDRYPELFTPHETLIRSAHPQ